MILNAQPNLMAQSEVTRQYAAQRILKTLRGTQLTNTYVP
jgi:hypothetical protein